MSVGKSGGYRYFYSKSPPAFPEDWDGVPRPDPPVSAAHQSMGGGKRDRSGQLGTGGLDSRTFTKDYDSWLESLLKIKVMLGPRK